ncbi:hypothetical protein PSH58_15415 [Pseudomonas hefeiensis]|uniref:DUF1652 domain-containing protein n=1 Tax=Pseudomonas hefeiensis TaxID=2738125 RepID=A0ABY9G3V7_9PSED|nr:MULTISPECIES: hypothetical protein [unclassified Pseudomonas]WLH10296.1 hypothetical protein PSH57_15390 [Pseudomonas sp. FP205]WLH93375.1 hypothetical protein PSH58_15415 [Pseudomonas sp. FP53]WLI37662.1 hypothetical protein PSH74_15340 [Pseudomonas sp. FP821]
MDVLSKLDLERLLSDRLPQCIVTCSINEDGCLSINVAGPGTNQFTISQIERSHYHGEEGIHRLVREILEEMVMSRQDTHLLD